MKRKFSAFRLIKLVKTSIILLTLASFILTTFSHYYSSVTIKRHIAKSSYCREKLREEYIYKITDCSSKEMKQRVFWENISQISPKILLFIIICDLFGYWFCIYLFPKQKKHSQLKGGEKK